MTFAKVIVPGAESAKIVSRPVNLSVVINLSDSPLGFPLAKRISGDLLHTLVDPPWGPCWGGGADQPTKSALAVDTDQRTPGPPL